MTIYWSALCCASQMPCRRMIERATIHERWSQKKTRWRWSAWHGRRTRSDSSHMPFQTTPSCTCRTNKFQWRGLLSGHAMAKAKTLSSPGKCPSMFRQQSSWHHSGTWSASFWITRQSMFQHCQTSRTTDTMGGWMRQSVHLRCYPLRQCCSNARVALIQAKPITFPFSIVCLFWPFSSPKLVLWISPHHITQPVQSLQLLEQSPYFRHLPAAQHHTVAVQVRYT